MFKIFNTYSYKVQLFVVQTFILAPLLVNMPLAFSKSEYLKIDGFTLKWFYSTISDPRWQMAAKNSFLIAFGSATISVLIAVLTNEILRKKTRKIQGYFQTFALIPLATPAIILALALLKWLYIVNLVDTILGMIGAHCILSLPVAYLLITHYTNHFFKNHPNLEQASALMGLTGGRFFIRVTLPNIIPSILGAYILAFAISFNEGVISQFLSGEQTLIISKKLFEGLRFEISPAIAAVSCLLMLFSIACYLFTTYLLKTIDGKNKL